MQKQLIEIENKVGFFFMDIDKIVTKKNLRKKHNIIIFF